jgi:hypothetical protein
LLRSKQRALTADIKGVDDIYSYQNSVDGVPLTKILPDWMNSVETDNLKAKIKVMDKQNKDFQPICYLRQQVQL